MRIVLAPDSFKECLPAGEVARALAAGCRRVFPEAKLDLAPMADGGEGTVEALVTATGGRFVDAPAHDPLGQPIEARFGVLGDGRTAVVEVAAASGLALVPPEQRHPGFTTTYGTGELMLRAIDEGVRRIIVGLGGSATNDAGAGMAQALGYGLRDADDREIPFGGFALAKLNWIDPMKVREGLNYVEVIGAYDVDSPLCGPGGASYLFGPQKGASPKTCEMLDAALAHFAEYAEEEYRVPLRGTPGSGAAGGLGAGLMVFCHAELRPGFEVVANACGLAERIRGAGLVITGEGRLDRQSLRGKVPVGVGRLAKAAGVPCWAVAGTCEAGLDAEFAAEGISGTIELANLAGSEAESLAHPARYLADAAERVARTILA
jgi:glycerate kinase